MYPGGGGASLLIQALRRLRQVVLSEFNASLGY